MDEYSRIAPLYDGVVGPFLKPVHEAMLDSLHAAGCGSVVDLCCGTGLLTGLAAQAGLRAVGVDISAAMLARARARRPRATFFLGDATATGLDDGSFAGCVVSFALHEKPAPTGQSILAEARRLVGPGGLILVADYRPASGAPLTGLAIRLVERLAGREHSACFRAFMKAGGSEPFLRRAGLSPRPVAFFMGGWAGLYRAGA
jgi:ubiquinone/menaquinone biosynthesis C-methylase UbiE